MLPLALARGRLYDEPLPPAAAAGIRLAADAADPRSLILPTQRADLRLILVRASDVPTYVQYGAADLGIAGRDLLAEHGGPGLSPAPRPGARRPPEWGPRAA